MTSDEDILAALQDVIDPELGINIVDLGLIYRAVWTSSGIDVALTMTSPSCPAGDLLMDEVMQTLRAHFAETSIRVELVWDPPWSPDLLSDEARRQLGWLEPDAPKRVLH